MVVEGFGFLAEDVGGAGELLVYNGRFGGATVCSGLSLVWLLTEAVFPAEPPTPVAGPVCPMGWYLFMIEVFFLCAASVAAMDIVGRGGISPDCLRDCLM